MVKKRTAAFFAALSILFLSSCSLIGAEKTDYSSESVIGSALSDAAVVNELTNIIGALSADSPYLTEFSGTLDAVAKFSDTLLSHMLKTNYSRFSGNTEVLKKAAKEYPHLNISVAIGASDFEGALYTYFNHGGNIRHGDTAVFRYLTKIKAYVPMISLSSSVPALEIVSIDETKSTYRMTFYVSLDGELSPAYLATFVKRENKDCYILSLKKVASEKVSYNIPELFS